MGKGTVMFVCYLILVLKRQRGKERSVFVDQTKFKFVSRFCIFTSPSVEALFYLAWARIGVANTWLGGLDG